MLHRTHKIVVSKYSKKKSRGGAAGHHESFCIFVFTMGALWWGPHFVSWKLSWYLPIIWWCWGVVCVAHPSSRGWVSVTPSIVSNLIITVEWFGKKTKIFCEVCVVSVGRQIFKRSRIRADCIVQDHSIYKYDKCIINVCMRCMYVPTPLYLLQCKYTIYKGNSDHWYQNFIKIMNLVRMGCMRAKRTRWNNSCSYSFCLSSPNHHLFSCSPFFHFISFFPAMLLAFFG